MHNILDLIGSIHYSYNELQKWREKIIMAEYNYRGFRISYKINVSKDNLYKADGKVIKQGKGGSRVAQKFHTEHYTESGAKKEIKKLIKNYVDFEWQEFHSMH
ncbi:MULTISPECIES: hypothetical protein [Legionella]|uniref:Uncharacterized protein n=1 Tax=Legionella maceachernii TaxID=466 RepID=A0A0W0VWP8_9GAMM|nr:hypothetical protein [Legionella maceachernii]KTD24540.1 hypothetical protein Lmac_2627 [Legionella maceachernii]SJZ62014.1 hypothetical protein SAMN02745128_00618 [Legionella maceachernii]SUP00943.1 Uncharacterised protein [Legionella maceachernii]